MKAVLVPAILLIGVARLVASEPNPAIDMAQHLRVAEEAARHREARRVSEAEFIRMSREPGAVVLDCRSREKYDLLHVRGAINLSFPDITVDSLRRTLPDKNTRILIYCNNNFKNAEEAFPAKVEAAALNISTYITLYTYGYRNVFELAPRVDPKHSRLEFESNVPQR